MLNNPKYPQETQLRWWALYYEVLEHIVESGLKSALKKYPEPIVSYFEEWNNTNPEG